MPPTALSAGDLAHRVKLMLLKSSDATVTARRETFSEPVLVRVLLHGGLRCEDRGNGQSYSWHVGTECCGAGPKAFNKAALRVLHDSADELSRLQGAEAASTAAAAAAEARAAAATTEIDQLVKQAAKDNEIIAELQEQVQKLE